MKKELFKSSYQRYILGTLLALSFLMGGKWSAWSQTLDIGSGTSTQRFPLGHLWGYERTASLYTAAEMSVVASNIITDIGWDVAGTAGSACPTKIYLATGVASPLVSTTWATMISGATLVYDGSTTPAPTNGWYNVPINPYLYSGGNLVVLVETNLGGSGGGTNPLLRYSSSTGNNLTWTADNNPPTGNGVTSSSRPNVRITYTAGPPCSGTPTPGNTLASANPVCSGANFTLSLQNLTSGTGVTYQWESADDAGFTANLTMLGTNSTETVSPSSDKYYRCLVTCTNTSTDAYSTPVLVTINNPIYASYDGVSYTEDFENWISGCDITEQPSVSWTNTPLTGNNSWRRNDQGTSASWTSTGGSYSPSFSQGAYSARFHSFNSTSGLQGSLRFYVDMSAASGNTRLSFDHINTSGTDVVKVFVSTDGGVTETQVGNNIGISSTWTNKTFDFNSNSGTTIIRIEATSDYGSTDIGIDNLKLEPAPACLSTTATAATNITNATADVNWTDITGDWIIEYGPTATFTPVGTGATAGNANNSILTISNANTIGLSGLLSGTGYSYVIRQDCSGDGDGYSTNSNTISFTTILVVPSPWVEPFTTTSTPTEWTTTGWNIGSTRGVTGNPGYNIYKNIWSSSSSGASFTTINVGPIQTGDELKFDYKVSNYSSPYNAPVAGSGDYVVEISTDFGATYTALETVTNDGVAGWRTKTYSLTSYIGQIVKVKITGNWVSGDYDMAFDNIKIEIPPTCLAPSDLTVTNITDNSADIDWTENGTATLWNVEYGTPGFTQGNGTVVPTNSNPFTLTGLSSGTTYEYYVQADCGGGDESSWVGPYSFTTECSLVTDFVETFDGVSTPALPNCWEKVGTSGSVYTQTSNSNSAPNTLYIYGSSSSATPIVSMQPVSNLGDGTHWFRFNMRANVTVGGEIQIGYLTDPSDASSFVDLGTVTASSLTYEEYTFIPVAGTYSNYPAIKHTGSPANSILIDDFRWEPTPTCIAPSALTATNITDNSADLGWTENGTATQWNIEHGASGFTQGSGTIVPTGSNPFTLSGLSPSTTYEYYVQADCGGGDESSWVGPFSFTTSQIPATIPYTDDFSANKYTFVNGTQTNKWAHGSAAGNPSDAIYISNDGGVTNAYTTSSSSVAHAYRDIAIPTGATTAEFSFDWRCEGEGASWDWMKVWLVPTSYIPTAGTQMTAGNGRIQEGPNYFLSQNTWTTYSNNSLDISSFAGQTMRLVFEWRNDGIGGNQPPAAVDNVSLIIPTCPSPTNLTLDGMNFTNGTADISWTTGGSGSSWNIAWGTSPYTPSTPDGNTTIDGSYVLNGLVLGTTYQAYIQADCDADGTSNWVGPITFLFDYCDVDFPSSVEPITLVEFESISNTTSAVVGGTPALEDFTSMSANVTAGIAYPIKVKGNTDGPYNAKIVVYVDWNQDGIFDNSNGSDEMYTLPDIYGSTGVDAIESNGTINVPYTALPGNTRMRVMKRFSTTPTPCNNAGFGQAEDYTLNVTNICDAGIDGNATVCEGSSLDLLTVLGGTPQNNGVWYDSDNNALASGSIIVDPSMTEYTYVIDHSPVCNESATVTLTVNGITYGTDIQSACDTYTWIDGNTYTSSNNTATWTLINAAGCDSIVTLDLTINYSTTGTDVQVACDTYTWIDGNTYTASDNSATWTLTNAAGCDSIVTLDLTINYSTTGTDNISTCATSYTWPANGQTYTSDVTGVTETLQTVDGCDSIVTLNLILGVIHTTDVQVACDTYTWPENGQTYTSSNNSDFVTLTSVDGCDSIITLDLTINYSTTGTDVQVACDTYTWIDGNTYTASDNSATWTLTNAAGCDSIITLDLTINYSSTGTDVITACDSYTWIDGVTYTTSDNTATWTLTNADGCDSIVTLDLTITSTGNAGADVTDEACQEESVDLDDLLNGADAGGVWEDENGNPITSPFTVSNVEGEVYNFNYIVGSGNCADTATITITVKDCSSSLTVEGLGNITVYPNPAHTTVNIENLTSYTDLRIEMIDVNGRVVLVDNNALFNTSEATIDISNFERGVYTLRVYNNLEQRIFKVVKQ
ncbi:MAG: fibronectin type III domain-containing protein [Brumimicrobium sp.]|nr:fibronectin type III domain-containing protein [Brumimicrobium sp.]